MGDIRGADIFCFHSKENRGVQEQDSSSITAPKTTLLPQISSSPSLSVPRSRHLKSRCVTSCTASFDPQDIRAVSGGDLILLCRRFASLSVYKIISSHHVGTCFLSFFVGTRASSLLPELHAHGPRHPRHTHDGSLRADSRSSLPAHSREAPCRETPLPPRVCHVLDLSACEKAEGKVEVSLTFFARQQSLF